MSIQNEPKNNPESYFKVTQHGIDILFQVDAYFMVSGLSRLTIALSHTSYGDFLTIQEFDASLN